MKSKRISTLLIVFLVMALMTINVFAQTNDDIDRPMDIRERLGLEDFNILESVDIVYKDGDEVVENPTLKSRVEANFNWIIKSEHVSKLRANDYFTFKLPKEFKIGESLAGYLDEFGSYTIDADGMVTMTFNENIETDYTVEGSVRVEANLNEEVIEGPGDHIIELPFEVDNQITVNVKPSNVDTTITKKGVFDTIENNPHSITWDVLFNQNYDTLTGVKIVDDMPDSLDVEKIEVYEVELNHDGTFKSLKRELDPSEYIADGYNISFHNELKTPHQIRYVSKIKDEAIPEVGGDLQFQNTAKVFSNEISEEGLETKTTLTARYGKLLEKNLLHYDNVEQSFLWEIKYNFGEKEIEDAVIVDVFDEGLKLVESSFKIFDKKGKEVTIDHTLTVEDNKLTITFNETVQESYVIKYKTQLKDQYVLNKDQYYENKVTTAKAEDTAGGTIKQGLVNKETEGIDYDNKQIYWAIDINRNNYKMKNYVLTDTYLNRGLSLDVDSFTVFNKTTNKELTKNEYTLTVNSDGNEEIGYTLTFKAEETSDNISVTFKTDYDINALKDDTRLIFVNEATLKWTDDSGTEHENSSEARQTVNNETINNGRKFGKYNAITKEITWQADVNYTSEKTNSARLVDKITERQGYLEGSLEIYLYTVDREGNISREEQLTLDDFEIQYPGKDNDYTLIVNFPDNSDSKYSVVFRTSVENVEVKNLYKNTATFENGKLTRSLKASVTIANGNKFVSKSGVQNGDYVDWSIRINESQSTIKDAKIIDEPSMSQIILEDSIKLYPVIVQENENYTIDYDNPLVLNEDYTLEIVVEEDRHHFIIEFLGIIDRTYVLEYSSQISLDVDENDITNRVKLLGNEFSKETGEDSTTIVIDVNQTSGSARGKKGSFKVKKTDPSGRALPGVKFELYNKFNRKMLSVITDENGEFEYHNLVYGTYTLYEIETLKGFVISDELISGVSINISEEHIDLNKELIFVNRMNEVIINKTDADGTMLDGAQFELLKLVGGDYVIEKNEFTVEEAGKIFYGLDAGQYRLQERVSPEGFVVNTIPYDFEIKQNRNNQELDVSVDFVNYKGSVELTKTGHEDEVLEGVVFDVYDDHDELVYESLVTDDQGKIKITNELAPGTYYFKEVSSVLGHIVNETPLYFTIASKAAGIPKLVSVFATNKKGSVTFEKVSDMDALLKDVEFKLFNTEDEELLTVVSDEEGVVRVDHLDAGDYYFVETKSLPEFIVNTEKITFRIPEKALEEEVVIQLEKFVNYRGGVIIEKIDEDGNLLNNARFKITDTDNKVIKKITTIDGVSEIDRLKPGSYKIVEIEAPEGYLLSEEELTVIIPEEHDGMYEFETVTIINKEIPKEDEKATKPKTGLSNNTFLYMSITLVSMCLLMTLRALKRKRDKH